MLLCSNCKRPIDTNEVVSDGCIYCLNTVEPYSKEDYEKAKAQGLDLDDWDDYCKFYDLGEDGVDDWWRS